MRLKYKLTIAFALFIVLPFLIVGWLSAYKASDTMKEELGGTTLQLVRQNHITLEKTMFSINDKTITFLDNHLFDPSSMSYWSGIETLSQIRAADDILERWSSDGTNFTLYMINYGDKQTQIDLSRKETGFVYLNVSTDKLPEWTEYALQAKGAGIFRPVQAADGTTDVRFMRSILNTQRYEENVGFLVVSNLKVLLTRDLVSVKLADNAGIYLYNEWDELLMQAGEATLRMPEVLNKARQERAGYVFANQDGRSWLFAYSRSPVFDTRLVYQIPLDTITEGQAAFQWLLMIVSAVYLILVLLFVLYILRIVVKPLVKLVHITKVYEPGKELEIGAEQPRSDEFGILHGAILRMTRRLDQSVEENYVMKIKQKENELTTLHSQITPHLLYNTLDSIYWYALDSGNTDVGEMVKDLSKLLRIGLSKGKTMVTIADELEHAAAYCRLQMMRYPDTFEVFWDIDELAKTYWTPKVILQPLIENAIFHAVSGMDGEGVIWIRVRLADQQIIMEVQDNGFIPVDVERLERIALGEIADKGYGIRNVHQRIQLHYGDAYGLRYEQCVGGGIRVIVTIPRDER